LYITFREGEILMGKYDLPAHRIAAKARAKDLWDVLFDGPHWAKIMKSVDPPPILESEFTQACKDAGLKMPQIKWLKKYLEQCDEAVYGDDDVAATGW
jgi:hypothetical protein